MSGQTQSLQEIQEESQRTEHICQLTLSPLKKQQVLTNCPSQQSSHSKQSVHKQSLMTYQHI